MSECHPKQYHHEVYTHKKGEVQPNYDCIPQKFILDFDFTSLRPIAQRQLISLAYRRKLTQEYELYNEQIQKLIQYEMELIKKNGLKIK
jgi:hypothetical protein